MLNDGFSLLKHCSLFINLFLTLLAAQISATLQLLLFFFMALFAFHPVDYTPVGYEPWPDFFHMPVLMLMLITLLNDGTLITIAYDYATASDTPNKWNIPALFVTSSVLGMVSCLSSLLVLFILLDSHNPDGFFAKVGMSGVDYGQITTAIYLKVSVSDFLTLFSARTGSKWFWQVKPAPILVVGGVTALTISSILSIVWPESSPDGIETEGLRSNMGVFVFIWLYCIFFWLVQDAAKVAAYKLMFKTNFNGINDTGESCFYFFRLLLRTFFAQLTKLFAVSSGVVGETEVNFTSGKSIEV